MLFGLFVIFQLMSFMSAQSNGSCTWLTCFNGGRCYRNLTTQMETCNCTAFYQGFQCEQKLPAFIWTPDELCQLRFGADFYSPFLTSILSCSYLMCRSLTDPLKMLVIEDGTGMICAPDSVCIDSLTCSLAKNAPPIDILDKMVGNVTCATYLNASNSSFAQSFCQNSWGLSRCPVSCQKYTWFGCADTLRECPLFASYCNAMYGNTNNLIRTLCPYTCGQCPEMPLRCKPQMNYCVNGGTCQNTTVSAGSKFGYRCVCPAKYTGEYCEMPNPCFGVTCPTGRKCTKVGNFNYVCA